MAATKFTAIYINNEGKIIERGIPGMNITSESGKTKYYVSCSACGRSGSISKQPARAAGRWNEKG